MTSLLLVVVVEAEVEVVAEVAFEEVTEIIVTTKE